MEYPYYIIPDIEKLPSTTGKEREKLIRRIAALVGDPLALRDIIGIDPPEFAAFYPDMLPPEMSTNDIISSFIDKYGDPTRNENSAATEIEELVPLPPADYDLSTITSDPIISDSDTLGTEEDETANLLNSFLTPASQNKTISEDKQPIAPKRTEQPVLSESLARAMIKNGNYSKALEIITDLSLKNPKKSIYFADQIRFLKKLILNQSKAKK